MLLFFFLHDGFLFFIAIHFLKKAESGIHDVCRSLGGCTNGVSQSLDDFAQSSAVYSCLQLCVKRSEMPQKNSGIVRPSSIFRNKKRLASKEKTKNMSGSEMAEMKNKNCPEFERLVLLF